jgi:hypothetical protein
LAGSVVITLFQNGWKKATDALDAHLSGDSRKDKANEAPQGEDATRKLPAEWPVSQAEKCRVVRRPKVG